MKARWFLFILAAAASPAARGQAPPTAPVLQTGGIRIQMAAETTNAAPDKLLVETVIEDLVIQDARPPAGLTRAVPKQGYLGLVLGQADQAKTRAAGLDQGVSVEDLLAGGPGAAAGILVGDLIAEVDNRPVTSPGQLSTLVRALPPGRKIVLQVYRKGRNLQLPVVLGERPLPPVNPAPQPGNLNDLLLRDGGLEAPLLRGGKPLEVAPQVLQEIEVLPRAGRGDGLPGLEVLLPGGGNPKPSSQGEATLTPVPQTMPDHGGLYVSGQVVSTITADPVDNALVSAYGTPDDMVAGITNTLGNGAYALRLPGPGTYRMRVSIGRLSFDKLVEVPAAGLQKVQMVLPVKRRLPQRPRGYLGLVLGQPAPAKLKAAGVEVGRAVSVEDVVTGSPAAAAGVQAEDLITGMDGAPVSGPEQMATAVGALPAGKKVVLQVFRNGLPLQTRAVLGQTPIPTSDPEEWLPTAAPQPRDTGVLDLLEELPRGVLR